MQQGVDGFFSCPACGGHISVDDFPEGLPTPTPPTAIRNDYLPPGMPLIVNLWIIDPVAGRNPSSNRAERIFAISGRDDQWRSALRADRTVADALREQLRKAERERDEAQMALSARYDVSKAWWAGNDAGAAGVADCWRRAIEEPYPKPGVMSEPLESLYRKTEALRAKLTAAESHLALLRDPPPATPPKAETSEQTIAAEWTFTRNELAELSSHLDRLKSRRAAGGGE